MPNLGFDLDCVVVDCLDGLKDAIYKEFGVYTSDSTYKPYAFYAMAFTGNEVLDSEIAKFIVKRVRDEDFYVNLEPTKGSIQGLKYLKSLGHDLFFISSRPFQHTNVSEQWLNDHGIGDSVVFHTHEKAPIVKSLSLDYYVDDVTKHLMSIYNSCYVPPLGLVVFDAPWNRDYNKMLFSKLS